MAHREGPGTVAVSVWLTAQHEASFGSFRKEAKKSHYSLMNGSRETPFIFLCYD
jgi:hypothetical protein